MPKIWSVYSKEMHLVLGISDEPGVINLTRPPAEDQELMECPFATLQCYDLSCEAELLNILFSSRGLDELIQMLKEAGYKVMDGRPQPYKFARL